jgi:hypothetical protein
MYILEINALNRLFNFGHLSFEYLLEACTATGASELKSVSIYFISADLFQGKNVCYSAFLLLLLITVIYIKFYFETVR